MTKNEAHEKILRWIEAHPNEQFIPGTEKCDRIMVKIPEGHWLRNGQTQIIVLHDNTYIERDATDPHIIHVRKK